MLKLFSKKNSSGTIQPIAGRISGVHTFPKGICPKVNVIARLVFELAYYDSVVHRFNHYTTRTAPLVIGEWGFHNTSSLAPSILKPFQYRPIDLMNRVFTNGPEDRGSIPGRVMQKTQKMVLDTALLSTQHYKVRIKGKVEQSWKGVAPSSTPRCSSY